jgi:hypothetical protein
LWEELAPTAADPQLPLNFGFEVPHR